MRYTVRSQVLIGTPVEAILDEAHRQNADLILMGSRGRQGVLRLVLGSVSHAILHSAPCPVVVFNKSTDCLAHEVRHADVRL